jgi:hypothetical protein
MKRLRKGAIAHDASYWCPLLVIGPQEEVMQVLGAVLGPRDVPELALLTASSVPRERQLMLHQPGQFPIGAIAPAIVCNCQMDIEGGSTSLLLWLHAAAANDTYAALSTAVEMAMSDNVRLQVTDLRRIEVRGVGADAAVAAALFVASGAGPSDDERVGARPMCRLPPAIDDLDAADGVHLVIPDPRVARPQALGSASAHLLEGIDVPADLHLVGGCVAQPAPEARVSAWRWELRQDFLGLTDAFFTEKPPIPRRDASDKDIGLHCPLIYVKQPWGGDVPGTSFYMT